MDTTKRTSVLQNITSPQFSRSPSPALSSEKVNNFGSGGFLLKTLKKDESRHEFELKH